MKHQRPEEEAIYQLKGTPGSISEKPLSPQPLLSLAPDLQPCSWTDTKEAALDSVTTVPPACDTQGRVRHLLGSLDWTCKEETAGGQDLEGLHAHIVEGRAVTPRQQAPIPGTCKCRRYQVRDLKMGRISRVSPSDNHKCPWQRGREMWQTHGEKAGTGTRGVEGPGQRWWQPAAPEGAWPYGHLGLGPWYPCLTCGLLSGGKINFCCFKPPGKWWSDTAATRT